MLSEPHRDSEAHHRVPAQDIRLAHQLLLLGGHVALDLVAQSGTRRRRRAALRGEGDGRRAAVDGSDVEEEIEAAALAGRITPTQADVRGDGVAELELPVQRAELRAGIRRAVDRVGSLARLPDDIQLRAI